MASNSSKTEAAPPSNDFQLTFFSPAGYLNSGITGGEGAQTCAVDEPKNHKTNYP